MSRTEVVRGVRVDMYAERPNEFEREVARLQAELTAARDMLRGDFWFWQGDGEDHLESLVCPVVIQPEVLAKLLALAARHVLCGGCGARYVYVPGIDERGREEHDRIARERHYQCARRRLDEPGENPT